MLGGEIRPVVVSGVDARQTSALEHDVIIWNRHHALALCLSMIFRKTGFQFSGSCFRRLTTKIYRRARSRLCRQSSRKINFYHGFRHRLAAFSEAE